MSKLNKVTWLPLCDPCLEGEGGKCHTPGCVFWGGYRPGKPLRERLKLMGCEITEISGEEKVHPDK